MKYLFLFACLIASNTCIAINKVVDSIVVNKTDKKMYLLSDGLRIKEYNVVFGANPIGHKQEKGDKRTPEGRYILDYKKVDSAFYKAIHISYPNKNDISNARAKGLNPGGLIMIHGQKNGFGKLGWLAQRFNWTNGCIAVTNLEMEEIWGAVNAGTPIEILP